jgi:hypothetical protein
LIAGLATLLTAIGCAAPKAEVVSPLTPDTRPVVDLAPYWCIFVSQEALRRITGLSRALTEHATGDWRTSGQCRVETANHAQVLTTHWSATGDSRRVLRDAYKSWRHDHPFQLPAELGNGFGSLPRAIPQNAQPYYVISSFTCGTANPRITLEISSITPGRNAANDLIEMMRVAQKRYGRLFSCAPVGK